MPIDRPVSAPPGLFDPARHEAVTAQPWDDALARAAVQRIVDAASQSFTPDGLWPTHPRDDPPTPEARYSMLYLGAGGVIWALRHLARSGLADIDIGRFDATVPTLVQRNRDVGESHLGGTASYLMGDSGLLLLQWQVSRDPAVADRLFDVVQGNLHHPAREMLWGSPGTLLAAVHMAEASGESRWAELLERGVRVLWDEMVLDEPTGLWLWHHDMYEKHFVFIGAGHGFAGNVFPILRGAALLPGALVDDCLGRAWQTLSTLAMREDGCANWYPQYLPGITPGKLPLVQDCHGSPGIVCRLASAPRTPEWDGLLNAAGELTWRAGPLNKGAGLCHGTAGNGYAFLALWQRTGDAMWLARARAFGMHAIEQVEAERQQRGHGWHSLWTGDLGVALYLRDCLLAEYNYPTMEVF